MQDALRLQQGRDEIGKETLQALQEAVCSLEGHHDALQETVHKRIRRLSLASRHQLGKALSTEPSEFVNTDTEDLARELLEYLHSMCATSMAHSGKHLDGRKYHDIQVVLGTSFLFVEKELDDVVKAKWKSIRNAAPSVANAVSKTGAKCMKLFMQTVLVISQFLPNDMAEALTATASLCSVEDLAKNDMSSPPCRLAVCFICQFLSKYDEKRYSPLIWAPITLLKWRCRALLGDDGCRKEQIFSWLSKLDRSHRKYIEQHFGKYMKYFYKPSMRERFFNFFTGFSADETLQDDDEDPLFYFNKF